MPDRYECQPEGWSDPPDEPDPDTNAQLWADRAPRGWVRCAGCGDQWAVEDDHECKCEEEEIS